MRGRTESDWDGRQLPAVHAAEIRKLHRAGVSKSETLAVYESAAPQFAESWERS